MNLETTPCLERLATRWQWKDQAGALHYVNEMETRHLYYVLRMIWNHSMPHKIGKGFKRYHFSSFYSREYMGRAILEIGRELLTRENLTGEMKGGLAEMAKHIQFQLKL